MSEAVPKKAVDMVRAGDDLAAAVAGLASAFPVAHDAIVAAAARVMSPDGVMEFTVSGLAKDAGVRMSVVKEWLKAARDQNLMHVLGRRTDNGKIRYCAYQHVPAMESIVS